MREAKRRYPFLTPSFDLMSWSLEVAFVQTSARLRLDFPDTLGIQVMASWNSEDVSTQRSLSLLSLSLSLRSFPLSSHSVFTALWNSVLVFSLCRLFFHLHMARCRGRGKGPLVYRCNNRPASGLVTATYDPWFLVYLMYYDYCFFALYSWPSGDPIFLVFYHHFIL